MKPTNCDWSTCSSSLVPTDRGRSERGAAPLPRGTWRWLQTFLSADLGWGVSGVPWVEARGAPDTLPRQGQPPGRGSSAQHPALTRGGPDPEAPLGCLLLCWGNPSFGALPRSLLCPALLTRPRGAVPPVPLTLSFRYPAGSISAQVLKADPRPGLPRAWHFPQWVRPPPVAGPLTGGAGCGKRCMRPAVPGEALCRGEDSLGAWGGGGGGGAAPASFSPEGQSSPSLSKTSILLWFRI